MYDDISSSNEIRGAMCWRTYGEIVRGAIPCLDKKAAYE